MCLSIAGVAGLKIRRLLPGVRDAARMAPDEFAFMSGRRLVRASSLDSTTPRETVDLANRENWIVGADGGFLGVRDNHNREAIVFRCDGSKFEVVHRSSAAVATLGFGWLICAKFNKGPGYTLYGVDLTSGVVEVFGECHRPSEIVRLAVLPGGFAAIVADYSTRERRLDAFVNGATWSKILDERDGDARLHVAGLAGVSSILVVSNAVTGGGGEFPWLNRPTSTAQWSRFSLEGAPLGRGTLDAGGARFATSVLGIDVVVCDKGVGLVDDDDTRVIVNPFEGIQVYALRRWSEDATLLAITDEGVFVADIV